MTASRMRSKATSRPHWSFSQINQLLRCPLQYYFERILKIPRTQTPSAMVLGSLVHEALAAHHVGLQQGVSTPLSDLTSVILETLQQSEAHLPIQFKPGESRASLIEQGESLVELYLREPPPTNIVGVEQPLIVPLVTTSGEVLEKPLVAVVDLLSTREDSLLVTEFKTSGRKYGAGETESSLQASCYIHAVHERFSKPAKVNFVVLIKTKTPAMQRIETSRCTQDLTRIGDIVQTLEKVCSAQAFFPVENAMNCSGCSFRQECRSWTGNTSLDRLTHRELSSC